MKKRIRNLLAILLSFSLVTSGNGAVFAAPGGETVPETAETVEGEVLLINDSKKTVISGLRKP